MNSYVNTLVKTAVKLIVSAGIVLGVSGTVQAAQYWNAEQKQWVSYTPSIESANRLARKKFKRKVVSYSTGEKPGTIIVDTDNRYLYHVLEDGKAMRYGIGVGREGFEWSGAERITRKAKWPGWTPPPEMVRREAKKGRKLPSFMPGGPENPMGARALYLGNTIYRIHGTNEDWSIGHAVSSGCIRMFNSDVEHLYDNVKVGAKVVVL
ncbi:L,D-transpeptidase [Pseudovibrio exalbescens]|uniref:L,D-transpeptidase n=1 Tax=Pseudovibrio exalbescens TaxID=197461 RepID=UPI00236555C7|nr:L,D-transpeptidase [Pseudovibrio exalbescens]MDD7909312.1 L,D-transpeptidase [Pseudovibrio exalbescens]